MSSSSWINCLRSDVLKLHNISLVEVIRGCKTLNFIWSHNNPAAVVRLHTLKHGNDIFAGNKMSYIFSSLKR